MPTLCSLMQPLLLMQLSLVVAEDSLEAELSDLLGHHRTTLPQSVNLEYQLDGKAGSPTIWINSVLPEQAGSGTYYSVQSHAAGYSSLQQVSWFWGYQGTVLFNVRDIGCDGLSADQVCPDVLLGKVHECGERAVCHRHAAGSGVYSRLTFGSSVGDNSYGFATAVDLLEGTSTLLYSGYFWAKELGGWSLISKIEVPILSGSQFLKDLHSFLEGSAKDQSAERSASLGPSLVYSAGSWRQITSAKAINLNLTPENKTNIPWVSLSNDKTLWRIGVGGGAAKGENNKRIEVSKTRPQRAEHARFSRLCEGFPEHEGFRLAPIWVPWRHMRPLGRKYLAVRPPLTRQFCAAPYHDTPLLVPMQQVRAVTLQAPAAGASAELLQSLNLAIPLTSSELEPGLANDQSDLKTGIISPIEPHQKCRRSADLTEN